MTSEGLVALVGFVGRMLLHVLDSGKGQAAGQAASHVGSKKDAFHNNVKSALSKSEPAEGRLAIVKSQSFQLLPRNDFRRPPGNPKQP